MSSILIHPRQIQGQVDSQVDSHSGGQWRHRIYQVRCVTAATRPCYPSISAASRSLSTSTASLFT